MHTQLREARTWVLEAGHLIKRKLDAPLEITKKSSRTDLMTNLDREVQQFLVQTIQRQYPQDHFLGEEDDLNQLATMQGRVWIIDPIDGTLNFIVEKENFCIMLAFFEEGVGKFACIYDVMQEKMYWGGKQFGVYCNDRLLPKPENKGLSEGFLGMNAHMFGENICAAKEIGKKSLGIRMSGCAGLEMIALLKGNHVGYLSSLYPWDYAAGIVLLEAFGFCYATTDGEALSFQGRDYFLAATPKAYAEISPLFKEKKS